MKFFYFFIIPLLIFLNACDFGEKTRLKEEVAKLKAELDSTEDYNATMTNQINEVDMMIDSIEKSQNILNVALEGGTTYDDYTDRLNYINNYINDSKQRLLEMEDRLAKSDKKNETFAAMISKLRKNLAEKEQNISALNQQVEKYKTENEGLITTVEIQKQQLTQQEEDIKKKEEALQELEVKINNLSDQAIKMEADAFFDRGTQMEELAKRTKFAPKKKKEALKDAYDFYKQAFELGRTDAFEKMEELEQKY